MKIKTNFESQKVDNEAPELGIAVSRVDQADQRADQHANLQVNLSAYLHADHRADQYAYLQVNLSAYPAC